MENEKKLVDESTKTENQYLTYDEVIKQLKKDGAIVRNDLKITKAKYGVTSKGNFIVTITIDGFVSNMQATEEDSDKFEKGYTRSFIISFYSLLAAISHNESLAYLCDIIQDCPKKLNVLLPGGTISILQLFVEEKDKVYHNLFNNKDNKIEYDTYYNTPVKIELGEIGKIVAARLLDKAIDE